MDLLKPPAVSSPEGGRVSFLQTAPSTPSSKRAKIAPAARTLRLLPMIVLLFCTSLVLSGPFRSSAQEIATAELPDAPLPQDQSQTPPDNPSALQSGMQSGVQLLELLQRKSLVFPDLATNQGPLTAGKKFQLAANNSVSVSTVGVAIISAGFSQAINSPSGYHQGMEGYGKRLGANLARSATDNFFGTFVLASALHQDPRFYVKENLDFGESVKYAARRVFFTRSDNGLQVTNYSGLLGPLAAESLANAYYPDENRGAAGTFTRYASDLGWRFAGNLLRQYWPTINKRLLLAAQPETQRK